MEEKISIYIVEDYFLTRVSYKHFFEKDDEILLLKDFESAEECLCSMEKKVADVLLVDLGLPIMNGIELTKIITKKYPKSKVIILTSHESEEEVLACFSSGAKGYVIKDLELEKLKQVIKLVHFGAFWFDPKVEQIPIKTLPKPQSTDFNNLYPISEIKKALTGRELEVLKLVVQGKSNSEIAEEIVVSPNTAKAHVCSILSKLSVSDRVQAAVKAVRENLF